MPPTPESAGAIWPTRQLPTGAPVKLLQIKPSEDAPPVGAAALLVAKPLKATTSFTQKLVRPFGMEPSGSGRTSAAVEAFRIGACGPRLSIRNIVAAEVLTGRVPGRMNWLPRLSTAVNVTLSPVALVAGQFLALNS